MLVPYLNKYGIIKFLYRTIFYVIKIFNSIKSGVITGNDIKKIFTLAKKNNFALPAINCISIDSINAALEAASNMKSPIILQFSNKGSAFISGFGLNDTHYSASVLGAVSGCLYIHYIASHYGVPVIVHTDHCTKEFLPWIDALLDFSEKHFLVTGRPLFSSHMLDLSLEPLEQNINISSKYLERMDKLDMMLEIELGCTGGEEDGISHQHLNNTSSLYTTPEDVAYAYEQLHTISSNFMIAASFGNVHGVYKPGNVKLNPKILNESQKYVSKKFGLPMNFLNFVFHGGSGTTLENIKEAIQYGVVKVNIDTDVQWAIWSGILEYYKNNRDFLQTQLGNPLGSAQPNKKFYDPRAWIRAGQKSMIKYLEKMFIMLNATNLL